MEKDPADVSHFNQSLLLQIDKSISAKQLQIALDQIVLQHDTLRLQFKKDAGKWHQTYGIIQLQLDVDDLTHVSTISLPNQVTSLADQYQRSLSITDGPLMRMVLMQTPTSEGYNRLLMIVHHLVIDGVSWRIMVDDLNLLITGLINGDQVSLGNKGSSYRQWHSAIANYGKSGRISTQIKYWEQITASYQPLPVDKIYNEPVTVKDARHHVINLNAELTNQLLHEIPKVYHTEINDILLSAFSTALCEWFDREEIIIGLEGHGREDISVEIDSSHTVGWFTTLYPVLLKYNDNVSALIKGVKEDLRRVPEKGIGYGVLKYNNKTPVLQGSDPWDVIFNYLGQISSGIRDNIWFTEAGENLGLSISEDQTFGSKLSVNSQISNDELVVRWSYNSKLFNEQTITQLANNFIEQLKLIINHCKKESESGSIPTPSDYGLGVEITYKELDKFLAEPFENTIRKEAIQSLYKLSGLQQGMLFHGLYDSNSTGYIDQFNCNISNVNRKVLLQSWSSLLSNHSILRSAFYYDSFDIPVQAVYKEVQLPVEEIDLRNLSENVQKVQIKNYELNSRKKGFDFKNPPIMRIGLLRLSENSYRMVWDLSSHFV